MFEVLTKKLESVFKTLTGRGVLSEAHLTEALKGIRIALLEADVHFSVVKSFIEAVRAKAIGKEVSESLSPGQQVIKIVQAELSVMMGAESKGITLAQIPPTVVLLVGLQGSGKTTTAGKLARLYKIKGKRVMLVAADLKRPAAVAQLQTLGRAIDVPVMTNDTVGVDAGDAVAVVKQAAAQAIREDRDLVIVDTAGRVHVDDALMEELSRMKSAVSPHEILLVADAMTGQTAVSVATVFHQRMGLTGIVLTKTEGDARGGAVLSMRAVTGAPIKFIGTGEKPDAIEPFYPDRMASRILGMGDILSLIELAEQNYSKEQQKKTVQSVRSGQLTLEDFSLQIKQMKKMGGIEKILAMIPGAPKMLPAMDSASVEREIKRTEAIISSMTPHERRNPAVLNGKRRQRIAKGSGTSVQDINRLIKQFDDAKKMMKRFSGFGRTPLFS